MKTPHNSFRVEIPALGDHMIYPTLMAAAVGEHFGLTQTQIADGVLHFAPTKMRMNLLHRGDDITILNDTYNANPQSMRAAVEVLSSARGAYKVAVDVYKRQVGVNVGMCLYVFPVVGLTLPFISYGGTSIVTMFAAMGIISSIKMRSLPSWLRDRSRI